MEKDLNRAMSSLSVKKIHETMDNSTSCLNTLSEKSARWTVSKEGGSSMEYEDRDFSLRTP